MMIKRNGIPGEYEEHYGTIAMYPVRNDIWRENAVYMQDYVLQLVNIIAKYEKVYLICPTGYSSAIRDNVSNNVIVLEMDYDDIWARDIAPSFTYKNGKILCIDWKFNAWGGKSEGAYFPWEKDDAFAQIMAKYLNLSCTRIPIVLEGGAIISDGNGTLFATRSVLLNRNRNPFKSKEYIEKSILSATGDKKIVWLKQGLFTDETNGHVDNIISVIGRNDICLAWTDDKNNPNYKRVREAYDIIRNETNIYGEKYIVHLIPLPETQYMEQFEANGLNISENSLERKSGDVLPASYINLYMVNGAVLVPAFGCKEDRIVLNIMKDVFQDREVIQIYTREPLLGGGGIHCILHEIPFGLENL